MFVTRSGCHRFTVMPFVLTGAPSIVHSLTDFVLCGLSYVTCLVYLSDIIIFGQIFKEHLVGSIRTANLKIKPSKCLFFQRIVSFLEHMISETGIAMQPEKLAAIRIWHNA